MTKDRGLLELVDMPCYVKLWETGYLTTADWQKSQFHMVQPSIFGSWETPHTKGAGHGFPAMCECNRLSLWERWLTPLRSFGLGIRIFPGGPTPDASDQHSALKGPEATGSNVRLSQQCRPQNVDVHLIVLLWSHSQGDRWFAKWAPWPDSSGGSFGNVGKRCRSRLRILPSTSVAFINFTKWEILGRSTREEHWGCLPKEPPGDWHLGRDTGEPSFPQSTGCFSRSTVLLGAQVLPKPLEKPQPGGGKGGLASRQCLIPEKAIDSASVCMPGSDEILMQAGAVWAFPHKPRAWSFGS